MAQVSPDPTPEPEHIDINDVNEENIGGYIDRIGFVLRKVTSIVTTLLGLFYLATTDATTAEIVAETNSLGSDLRVFSEEILNFAMEMEKFGTNDEASEQEPPQDQLSSFFSHFFHFFHYFIVIYR